MVFRFYIGIAPEFGLSRISPISESYLTDRGHLEKELCLLDQQKGVEMLRNPPLKISELSEEPEKRTKSFLHSKRRYRRN